MWVALNEEYNKSCFEAEVHDRVQEVHAIRLGGGWVWAEVRSNGEEIWFGRCKLGSRNLWEKRNVGNNTYEGKIHCWLEDKFEVWSTAFIDMCNLDIT